MKNKPNRTYEPSADDFAPQNLVFYLIKPY
jgi:hypothetical protein